MKDKNYWKRWIASALVRAVKTAAQTAVSLIGTGAVGFTELNWTQIFWSDCSCFYSYFIGRFTRSKS